MSNLQKANKEESEITELPVVGPEAYRSAIRIFNRWANGRKITIDTIIEYLKDQQKTKKPSTVSAIKFGLKKSIKELMSIRATKGDFLLLDDAFKEIKVGKRDVKVYAHRLPSKADILKICKNSDERTGLIIETLFYTGMRISELINAELRNCSADDKYVYIKIIGKGSKEREIFMQKKLFTRLRKVFNGRVYLFETDRGRKYRREVLWKMIKQAGVENGREDLHPHMLRHCCATYLLKEKKMSLKAVSNFLGHSDVAITANVYIEDILTPGDVYGK